MSAADASGTPAMRSRKRAKPPRDQVVETQRKRIVAAAIDAAAELGYYKLTVAAVINRARVSRRTFYDMFSDRDDCFLAGLEQTVDQARALTASAYAAERGWREGIRAALEVLLNAMEDDPGLARLWVIETPRGGRAVLERRALVLDELAAIVDAGRPLVKGARLPPDLTAQAIVGGILEVLHDRLLNTGGDRLTDLLGPLMHTIVLPYLGPAVANRELSIPVDEARRSERPHAVATVEDPLAGLKIRLTYRTIRVLEAISDSPGASNRDIGERSGIFDQGQISKLLYRLARLELIENRNYGQATGAANSWHLLLRGAQLLRATRPGARRSMLSA